MRRKFAGTGQRTRSAAPPARRALVALALRGLTGRDVLTDAAVANAMVVHAAFGGSPEVMLHLRRLGLLALDALTVTGEPLGCVLEWWEASERRAALRARLRRADGVDPDDVIVDADRERARGLTSTVTFPRGNLAPEAR